MGTVCIRKSPNDYFRSAPVLIASLINVVLLIFIVYLTQKLYVGNELKDTVKEEVNGKKIQSKHIKRIQKVLKLSQILLLRNRLNSP